MKSFRSALYLVFVSVLAVAGPSATAQQGTVTFPGSDVLVTTGDATTSTFRVFNSANAELMRVAANGNVGIGTATPGQKLEIFNGSGNQYLVISTPVDPAFAVNTPIGGLRLGWKYSSNASNNVDLQVIRGSGASDGAGLAIFTSPSNTETVERMRITSAGRVGIGYSAPTAQLMVLNRATGVPAFHTQQESTFSANTSSTDVGGSSLMHTTVNAGVTNSGLALGHSGTSRLWGTGTLTNAVGLLAEAFVYPGQTGTITTAYGLLTRVKKNDGVVGTGFGVYIEDVTATNDYGIYQVGADDSNYFLGDVTVGASGAQGNKLLVNGNVNVTGNLSVNGNFSIPTSGSYSVGGAAPSGYPFYATSSTPSVSAAIQLHSNYYNQSTSFIGNLGTYGTYISHNREPQLGGFTDAAVSPNQSNAVHAIVGDTVRGRMFQIGNMVMAGSPLAPVETPRLVVKYNGNVGIGSTSVALDPQERLVVDGNINVTGNINAKYQDIAEWVPASNDLAPGTVVVLDAALGNGVMASTTAYDTRVAGVVSAQPGIILGESGASKEQVATTGRVRVKVDATRASIAVGDLLVTSDRPGYAMRSIPVDLAGIAIHRPGTIVGKALEALASGEGEVLVLLSLQ